MAPVFAFALWCLKRAHPPYLCKIYDPRKTARCLRRVKKICLVALTLQFLQHISIKYGNCFDTIIPYMYNDIYLVCVGKGHPSDHAYDDSQICRIRKYNRQTKTICWCSRSVSVCFFVNVCFCDVTSLLYIFVSHGFCFRKCRKLLTPLSAEKIALVHFPKLKKKMGNDGETKEKILEKPL